MNERVIRARRILNSMFLFILVMTLLGDALSFRFGLLNGIYKTVVSLIPLTATFFMIDAIIKGEKKSREKISFFLVLGVAFAIFIISTQKVFSLISIVSLLIGLLYLVFVIYLFASKDMKSLFSYTNTIKSLKWLWSWKGICIGYKKDDYLWSYNGENIGRFYDNEIYSPEGNYLGELYSNGRLAIDKSKIDKKNQPFEQPNATVTYEKPSDTTGMAIYPNFIDFS
jgi:hypothetical protein